MAVRGERKRILIVVRTYPAPSKKSAEASCTAGITDDGKWIRLFPIPYRFLEPDKQFAKYQWIEAMVRKASDARPESFNIDVDSIKILSSPLPTDDGWRERKGKVLPLAAHCLCCLKEERDRTGKPTLGLIKPAVIERFIIEKGDDAWTPTQLEMLRQGHLFNSNAPKVELEKVPYDFSYVFRCDHASCTGHNLCCTDWEAGQAWRSWSRTYGDQWESKFRQKFEQEMLKKNDTYFFVGTVRAHPHSWTIVGLFYPPITSQLSFV